MLVLVHHAPTRQSAIPVYSRHGAVAINGAHHAVLGCVDLFKVLKALDITEPGMRVNILVAPFGMTKIMSSSTHDD